MPGGYYLINALDGPFLPILQRIHLPSRDRIVEIRVEQPKTYDCEIRDPGGLLQHRSRWSIWLPTYPHPDRLTGIRHPIFYGGERPFPGEEESTPIANGRARFTLFPSMLSMISWDGRVRLDVVSERTLRLSYRLTADEFDNRCVIELPAPNPAKFNLRMTCPKGKLARIPWPVWRDESRNDASGLIEVREDFGRFQWMDNRASLSGETLFGGEFTLLWGVSSDTSEPGAQRAIVTDGAHLDAAHPAWCGNPLEPPADYKPAEHDEISEYFRVETENQDYCLPFLPVTLLEKESLRRDPLFKCSYDLLDPTEFTYFGPSPHGPDGATR